MADIAMIWDTAAGMGDWALSVGRSNLILDEAGGSVRDETSGVIFSATTPFEGGTGLVSDLDLQPAVLISLFTDAQAAAGSASNSATGTAFYLGAGVAGVSATGAAAGPITGGAEIETNASLRSRMLIAYQRPPQGGLIDDYGEWALAVPGVHARMGCTERHGPRIGRLVLHDGRRGSGAWWLSTGYRRLSRARDARHARNR